MWHADKTDIKTDICEDNTPLVGKRWPKYIYPKQRPLCFANDSQLQRMGMCDDNTPRDRKVKGSKYHLLKIPFIFSC